MLVCKNCNAYCLYNERHDAYFCSGCDEWIEKACDDPKCFYCVGRPLKPSMIKLPKKNKKDGQIVHT
jgi:hypothetical protein